MTFPASPAAPTRQFAGDRRESVCGRTRRAPWDEEVRKHALNPRAPAPEEERGDAFLGREAITLAPVTTVVRAETWVKLLMVLKRRGMKESR